MTVFMMYFQALFCVSCTLCLAFTSAADYDFPLKWMKNENLFPDTATYRDGWWDRRNFKCPSPWGTFSDPDDCTSYYVCSGSRSSHKRCSRNKWFDMYRKVCLPKALAICDSKNKKTTPRNPGTTTPNDDQFSCPSFFGLFPHPKICAQYYSCSLFLPSLKTCPLSQLFDAIKKECQPEDSVHCGSRERPTTTTSRSPSTVSKIVPPKSTSMETESTSNPSTFSATFSEGSTSFPETPSTPEMITSTEMPKEPTETSTLSTVTTVKPTGPPDHNCDEDDVDCIITETGDVTDWFTCPEDMGSHPHPSSDKLFIFCLNWKPSVKKCGQDLVFSKELLTCTSP